MFVQIKSVFFGRRLEAMARTGPARGALQADASYQGADAGYNRKRIPYR